MTAGGSPCRRHRGTWASVRSSGPNASASRPGGRRHARSARPVRRGGRCWCANSAAVVADIVQAEIVGKKDEDVRLLCCRRASIAGICRGEGCRQEASSIHMQPISAAPRRGKSRWSAHRSRGRGTERHHLCIRQQTYRFTAAFVIDLKRRQQRAYRTG
jgi:hypothetical protein